MHKERERVPHSVRPVVAVLCVGAVLALLLAFAAGATVRASSAARASFLAGDGARLLPVAASGPSFSVAAGVQAPVRSAPDRCSGCHVPPTTYHYGLRCGQCHSASRFLPTKVSVPAHPMPLLGRHATLQCDACHSKAKAPSTECTACHSAPKGHVAGACTACHNPEGWAKSAASAGVTGPAAPHLVSAKDDCLVCHAPSGPNWPAPASHAAYSVGQCRLCHRSSAKASVTQNHDAVSALFQGRHTQLACVQCHSNGQFRETAQICGACHGSDDRHGGQFGQDCSRCHTPQGWAGVTFNHSQTGFSLTGAHSRLGCTNCHSGGAFAGAPRNCAGCHGEPAYHAGVLGNDCASCHNTGGWLPASYAGQHTFPQNHKGASGCRTCHPSSLSGYTCFGCHNEGQIAEKHKEKGIPDYGNCVGCHPNGNGG